MVKVSLKTNRDMSDDLPRPEEYRPGELPATRIHTWLFPTQDRAQSFKQRLLRRGYEKTAIVVGTVGRYGF